MREALKIIAILLVLLGGLGVGLWEGAEWYAKRDLSFAVVWLDVQGKKREAADVCHKEAEKYAEAGRNTEAVSWLDRSIAYAREVGAPLWTGHNAEETALLYDRLGDSVQRAILLSEARTLYLAEQDFTRAAVMANNLGYQSLKKQVFPDAEKWYLQAIADIRDNGAGQPNPLYYRKLGEVYLSTERPEEAITALEEAIRLAREKQAAAEEEAAAGALVKARRMYDDQSKERAREAARKKAAEHLEIAPM